MKENSFLRRLGLTIGWACLAWAMALPASAALTHRYSFTNDVSDSVGGANGTIMNNVTISGGAANFPGTNPSGPAADYILLPPGLVSNYTSVTFEMWANVGVNSPWPELYAFGNTNASGQGANMVMFTPHSGPGDFRMSYAQADPGFSDEHVVTGLGVLDGLNVFIACVYDPANNTMTLYTNGVRVNALSPVTTGPKGFSLTNVYNVYSFLGRSLYNGDGSYTGSLDEFRIFNSPLGPLQVAVDNVVGPDTVVTNITVNSIALNLNTNMFLGERQDTTVTYNTASYGSFTVPGATEVTYSTSDTNVVQVTRTGRLFAMSAGTATISATYGATASSKLVHVLTTPVLLHRYSFTADASDSVGGANGTLQGGATIVNKAVVLSGTGSSGTPGDYVDLPNNMFTNLTSVSMEVWATDKGSATWARIWDFGNSAGGEDTSTGGGDNLFLTTPSGAGGLRLAINLGTGEQQLNTDPLIVGNETHIVFVNDVAHQVGYLYVNGALVDMNPNMTLAPADMGETLNDWLGRSQYNDPLFNGSIDEFRIWQGQLSAFQIAINDASGPDTIGPSDPGAVQAIRLTINTNVLAGSRQTAHLYGDFALVTNVNLATAGATFTSGNTNVATVNASGLITAKGIGTTTITASYGGKSDNKPITVTVQPTVLTHRWSFNEASGTTVSDSVGSANGTLSASGATLGGGSVTLDGLSGYVNLPPNLITGYQAVTFETWVTINSSTVGNINARMFVFGSVDGVNEVGFTALSGGGNTFLRYFGPAVSAEQAGTLAMDLEFHIVGIFNPPGGTVDLYVNGIWQNSVTNFIFSLASITNSVSRLGAVLTNNPTLFTAAAFNEFRIYNGALDLMGLRTSFAAGPENPVMDGGTPTTLTLRVDPMIVLGSRSTPNVHCDFASVTNVDLTEASEISYSSSDPTVVSVTPDGRLQAVASGSANITASFRGKSATKPVTVFPKQTMLVHRYSFTNDVSDSVGVQDGVLFGDAMISSGAALLNGAATLRNSYVNLPDHLISSYDSVTLEAWVGLNATLGTWARIIDFGDQSAGAGGLSYVFLCPHTGGGGTRAVLSDGVTGANEAVLDFPTAPLDGFSGQVAVVYDPPNNLQSVYTNGVLMGSASLGGKLLSGVRDRHCWLGKSLYAGDAGLAATIDEFRIYAGAMSASQLSADFAAGPDRVVLPPPVSAGPKLSISHSGASIVLSWADPGNSFTIQSRIGFGAGSSWAPLSVTINRVNGTATATIPITGQTSFYRLSNP
jgi:hypothetical protein